MDEYTPTTEEIRGAYAWSDGDLGGIDDYDEGYLEAFDRWLADNDKEVAARAWDKGKRAWSRYEMQCENAAAAGQGVMIASPLNPYRSGSEGKEL
jgi:hypothetical protein